MTDYFLEFLYRIYLRYLLHIIIHIYFSIITRYFSVEILFKTKNKKKYLISEKRSSFYLYNSIKVLKLVIHDIY